MREREIVCEGLSVRDYPEAVVGSAGGRDVQPMKMKIGWLAERVVKVNLYGIAGPGVEGWAWDDPVEGLEEGLLTTNQRARFRSFEG